MSSQMRWFDDDEGIIIKNSDGDIRVVDSYSQWVLGHGRDFDLSDELNREHPDDFNFVGVFSSIMGDLTARPGPRASFELVAFDLDLLKESESLREGTEFVARLPLRRRNLTPEGTGEKPEAKYLLPQGADKEKMVIVGVMDDAINIGHERFRDRAGNSRVDYAWIQDADAQTSGSTVPFGREWSNRQISDLIAGHPDDDDTLMEALHLFGTANGGYRPSSIRSRRSHGTHVADLAAGYDPANLRGVNRRLITVQLPSLASQDTSGAALIAAVMSAASFIFERSFHISQCLRHPIPVILNFSYAFNSGPRSGLHVIERRIRRLAIRYKEQVVGVEGIQHAPPVELVLPAGNSHLTQTHAENVAAQTAQQQLELELRLQPQDRTSSYLELWFPEGAKNMKVTIESPGGLKKTFSFGDGSGPPDASVLAAPHSDDDAKPNQATITARIRLDRPNNRPSPFLPTGEPEFRVLICFAPTLVFNEKRTPATQGVWKVSAAGKLDGGGKILAWIQRDESFASLGIRGRQAYFEDEVYDESRFDRLGDLRVTDWADNGEELTATPIKRDGTLSGIATNRPKPSAEDREQQIVVTGAYRWDSGAAAVYSAAGSDTIEAPMVMCVSDTSRVLAGVLGACTRSGGRCLQNGTSVAAPQVVRCLADHFEANTNLADRSTFDSHAFFNPRGGSPVVEEPRRPKAGAPEIASDTVIRQERVGAGLLPLLDDHKDNVGRGVERKLD